MEGGGGKEKGVEGRKNNGGKGEGEARRRSLKRDKDADLSPLDLARVASS